MPKLIDEVRRLREQLCTCSPQVIWASGSVDADVDPDCPVCPTPVSAVPDAGDTPVEISAEKICDWAERALRRCQDTDGPRERGAPGTDARAAYLLSMHAPDVAQQRDQARAEVDRLREQLAEVHCARRFHCPTSGETESPCHGGFTVCCDRPDLHQPVDVTTGGSDD